MTIEHVYVFRTPSGGIKVGRSVNPAARAAQIQIEGIEIAATRPLGELSRRVERLAHRLLAVSGRHIEREWFAVGVDEAVAAIEQAERIVKGLEAEPEGLDQYRASAFGLGRPVTGKRLEHLIHVRISQALRDELMAISKSRLDAPDVTTMTREALADYVRKHKGS